MEPTPSPRTPPKNESTDPMRHDGLTDTARGPEIEAIGKSWRAPLFMLLSLLAAFGIASAHYIPQRHSCCRCLRVASLDLSIQYRLGISSRNDSRHMRRDSLHAASVDETPAKAFQDRRCCRLDKRSWKCFQLFQQYCLGPVPTTHYHCFRVMVCLAPLHMPSTAYGRWRREYHLQLSRLPVL